MPSPGLGLSVAEAVEELDVCVNSVKGGPLGCGQWKRSRLYARAASSMNTSSSAKGDGTGIYTADKDFRADDDVRRPIDAATRWRSTVPVYICTGFRTGWWAKRDEDV